MLLKPRTREVILYQGDDMERATDLRRAAEVAERKAQAAKGSPLRQGDEAPTAEAEWAALHEFLAEAAERALSVRLQAIGSTRFADLLAAHPPRMVEVDGEDKPRMHDDDAAFEQVVTYAGLNGGAVNVATFGKALLKHREGRATITEPDLSEADLAEFLDEECAEGDIERLWTAAYFLNRGLGDPKGFALSETSPS